MKKITKTVIAVLLSFGSTVCAAQDMEVCSNSSYTVPSVVGVSAATYEWVENGTVIDGADGESYTNPAGKPAGNYMYVRRAKTAGCDWQTSNVFIVSVTGSEAAPAISKTADGCAGSDYALWVQPVAGATYDWSGSSGGTAAGNSYTAAGAAAGTITGKVQIKSAVCPSEQATAQVTVYAVPAPSISPSEPNVCEGGTVTLTASGANCNTFRWLKGGSATNEGQGYATAAYTTAALTQGARYSVVAGNGACSATSSLVTVLVEQCTTPAGATVNFTAFKPDPSAATGTVWYLADTRENNNPQTYTVKKMQDNHIWMVQDLKFGSACTKTSFSGSTSDVTGKLSTAPGYTNLYGDCRSSTVTNAGYYYDWLAAMQKSGAYSGGSEVGCSGTASGMTDTAPSTCQGLCPDGWHIPTGNTNGECYALHYAPGRNCSLSDDACWNASSDWAGVISGDVTPSGTLEYMYYSAYRTSTRQGSNQIWTLMFAPTITRPGTDADSNPAACGQVMRCLLNY